MATSPDGYIAGPNDEAGGLHDWFFPPSGRVSAGDDEVTDESIKTTGAILMGRRTYNLGDKVDGFVDTSYRVEHFVLFHDVPEQVAKGETCRGGIVGRNLRKNTIYSHV